MRRQAERWGAELYQEDVEFIDVKNAPFTVRSSERKVKLPFVDRLTYYVATKLILAAVCHCIERLFGQTYFKAIFSKKHKCLSGPPLEELIYFKK